MAGGKITGLQSRLPEVTFWEAKRCFVICTLVAVATFQYGLDTGVINGFQAMQGFLKVFGVYNPKKQQYVIETSVQQAITSLLQAGLIVSSCLVGPLSRYFGRRWLLILPSLLSIIALLVQIFITSHGALYVARLLLGISNGFLATVPILYISEAAPAHLRGTMVATFQPFTTLGGVVGSSINKGLEKNTSKISYQAQLCVLFLVPAWLCIYCLWLPESPRWLAARDQNEKALQSLRRLRGNSVSPEIIQQELEEIKESLEIERRVSKSVDWREMFRGPDLRRTLLTLACATFHASSGINFLVGYATVFFQAAGSTDSFSNTIIFQIVGLAGALVALPLTRYVGRIPLLTTAFSIDMIAMFLTAIIYTLKPHSQSANKALVAFVCIYNFGYNLGVGPVAWTISGEMPSNRLRSWTFGFGMGFGFFWAWLCVFATPYFINSSYGLNWGGKYAWIWFPSNLVTLVFILLFVPETKGRTLEELDELFYNRVPARKFKNYRCRGMPAASSNDEPTRRGSITHSESEDHKDLNRDEERVQ